MHDEYGDSITTATASPTSDITEARCTVTVAEISVADTRHDVAGACFAKKGSTLLPLIMLRTVS